MTKVSRKHIEAAELNRMEHIFWQVVASLKNPSEASLFFKDLLTRTERQMLVKRLQIALLLSRGIGYRIIRKRLKVSDVTIAKINNWLKAFGDGYRLGINKIGKQR